MRALPRRLGRPRASRRREPLDEFARTVEPALVARARVHRFAEPPLIGEAVAPVPIAVAIDSTAGRELAARTRTSIQRQTVEPAAVVELSLNRAIEEGGAAWIAVPAAGALLSEKALERLGQAVALAPSARVVTTDDDAVGRAGRRSDARLHPGPSPDHMAARDPAHALMAVDCAAARVEPALRGDVLDRRALTLGLAGDDAQYHAHVPLLLAHRTAARDARLPRPVAPPRRPLTSEPSIEVIVCLRDRPDLLQRCAGSLLGGTSWDRLTLRLVDNASVDPATAAVLSRLARDPRVTVESDPREFNFSALNHAAAERSQADLLVFLNNDTEVIEPGWAEALAAEAMRPEVGAVAPLLLYPGGRVQHAGVAIGIHGWAGHPFAGLAPDQRTPFGAAADGTRNWLAVTGACMMVQRRKYLAVGGFDPAFAVGGGDVDLCLRLTAAGHRSLCVPHARLIHDESASRDPAAVPPGDFEASRRSYGGFRTVGDPFYHPALTLRDTSCRLRGADEPLPGP